MLRNTKKTIKNDFKLDHPPSLGVISQLKTIKEDKRKGKKPNCLQLEEMVVKFCKSLNSYHFPITTNVIRTAASHYQNLLLPKNINMKKINFSNGCRTL